MIYDGPNPSGVGDSNNSDEILEFDPLTGQWKLVDRMIQNRSNHAVAVINYEPGLCVEPPSSGNKFHTHRHRKFLLVNLLEPVL